MCKRLIFFALILYLHCCVVYAHYDFICPSEQCWHLRAKYRCPSVEIYTCLLDSVQNISKESCRGPKTEPPGDKTVVNTGNFDTKPCSQNRFQPFPFSTSQGNDCIFKKSMCSDDGQIVNSIGTSINNRECRCDHTRSFSFISKSRKNGCSCDPFKEDCSCFMKPCGQGELLSPDYRCIRKKDSYGKFGCEEKDVTKIQPITGTVREVIVGDISKPITLGREVPIAAITLIFLSGILISIFILWIFYPWIPDKIVQILNIKWNVVEISEDVYEFYREDRDNFPRLTDYVKEGRIKIYKSHKRKQNIEIGEDPDKLQHELVKKMLKKHRGDKMGIVIEELETKLKSVSEYETC